MDPLEVEQMDIKGILCESQIPPMGECVEEEKLDWIGLMVNNKPVTRGILVIKQAYYIIPDQ